MTSLEATTIGFELETWSRLTARCERIGVAEATYVHDATVARLASDATTELLVLPVIDRLVHERLVLALQRRRQQERARWQR